MSGNTEVALRLMKIALALLERGEKEQWLAECRLQHAIDSVVG